MSHSPDLQNSYGPEMAASEHHSNYGPQTVADDGPEAIPGQYYAAGQDAPQHIAPPYAQQAEKNDDSQGGEAGGTPAGTRKKILGLPVAGFWLLVGGFVLLVLGVSLGVGLGVGLSQKSTATGSGGSSATSSAVPAGSQTSTTSAASSSASSVASTTTSSATSTSSSAAASDTDAPGASVAICQNAYQDYCTTISVPASSCINFPSSYNDSVSSVDTNGPTCLFYTDDSCAGDYWSTNGTQNLIPGEFNDAFSSVSCK